MYEIKSVNGQVLYTSKTAPTVKDALIEAISTNANLEGANLRGADLRGANLRDANLEGANLRDANLGGTDLGGTDLGGANLGGVDLRDAYLRDANLEGANLEGANLRGTNLRDANLGGTDLRGAYLEGANLEGAWVSVAAKLTESLQAMNDSGRHWTKHTLSKTIEDGSTAYCSIGSIEHHSEGTIRALALWLLSSVVAGDIAAFNDHPNTTWEDIKTVFGIAIKHAQRFAS